MSIYDWSKTPADNATSDANINWSEGQPPSTVNNSARVMMAEIAKWRDDGSSVADSTGTANAYLVTLAAGFTTLARGRLCVFKASFANTGAATLNVNSTSAKDLKSADGVTLVSGAVKSEMVIAAIYDGTEWRVLSFGFTEADIATYNQGNASNVRTDIGLGLLAIKNTVGTSDIDALAVTAAELASGAVTSTKIAADAVDAPAVASDAIVTASVTDDAITLAKMAHGTANRFVGYDATGIPTEIDDPNITMRTVSLLGEPNQFGGEDFRIWVTDDNVVWAAGRGNEGQNGSATWNSRQLPNIVKFNLTPETITKVAVGRYSCFVLDDNGDVWAWGYNNGGQLGLGGTGNDYVARKITALDGVTIVDVVPAVGVGGSNEFTAFLTDTGALYMCGNNDYGQLGVGDTTQRNTPTLVSGITGAVASVHPSGSNRSHTIAITTSGSLYTTGNNATGQLGHGDTTLRTAFTFVGGFTNASTAVAVSGHSTNNSGNSFVIKTDGTLWACGYNNSGQLGQGDTAQRTVFTQVGSLAVSVIAATNSADCTVAAVTTAGNLNVWGKNSYGQVGNGTTSASVTSPYQPTGSWQGSVTDCKVGGDGNGTGVVAQSENALFAAGYSEYGNLGTGGTSATNSTFANVTKIGDVISDFRVIGSGSGWGLSVLYSGGIAAVCGRSTSGCLGMQVNLHTEPLLVEVWPLTRGGRRGEVGAVGAAGQTYSATSTTSLSITTGSKVLTTQSGLAYLAGTRARAASAADTANYMEGPVASYTGTTLTITVDHVGGSGTYANWNLCVAGDVGATGPGLGAVVDDTTPQLGGDLDVNGHGVVSVSAGDIPITPDTTGSIVLDGLSWPQADGSAGAVLKTDGAAQIAFGSVLPTGVLVGTTDAQTLTNKTLTSPTLTGGILSAPTLTLKQSAAPVPTAEGDIQWDTDNNKIIVGDGAGQKIFSDDTKSLAVASNLSDLNSPTTARTNLGVAIGSNVQAFDATLTSLATLGTTADRLAYTTGVDSWAEWGISAAGRAILDDANAAAQRTTLGLVIGTDVQAFSAQIPFKNVGGEWTREQNFNETYLTDGATINWNVGANQVCVVTIAGNRTVAAVTNSPAGCFCALRVQQDGTGSRTLAWNAAYKWPGGTTPTLTTTASAIDLFVFWSDGNYLFNMGQALDIQ